MPQVSLPGAERLYASAPCGLLVADRDGTVLGANATACRWLQCAAEDIVGRKRFQDLLTMGGRIFWQTHLQPLLRMQGTVAEVKLELLRPSEPPLPVMVNIAEEAHAEGRLLHIAFLVAEDRHRYERELLLQRRRAEQLAEQHARDQEDIVAARAEAEDRAKFAEQLVGVVSHDIRNPLSVINMSALILDRGVGPEQQKQAVGRIVRAVRQTQHLISDLLDFSQARLSGGLAIRKRSCDVQQAIADAVAELATAFPDSSLRHERAGAGACEVDPERIVQAVGNLVANAVNHGARGEPITVRTEVSASVLRVSVHNHGTPIPPEVLPTLFQPMVRGASAGPGKGVGLGLFIVREIARGHGAQVRVGSDEQGTCFTIELPRASSPA